jgi:uncharacterized linocin/CFP29 family protein
MVNVDAALPWTDEQWSRIQGAIQDAARRARVGASFLPTHGPLPPGQAYVSRLELQLGPPLGRATESLEIDEGATLRLVTISCVINLKSVEVHDPQLEAATQLLVRAATVLAHLEDEIIFNGLSTEFGDPARRGRATALAPEDFTTRPNIYIVSAFNEEFLGLLRQGRAPVQVARFGARESFAGQPKGTSLALSVADAVARLESAGQYGPFACVLGHDLYLAANQPTDSLVVPSELVRSYLSGGPFLRCSAMPPQWGIVMAMAGSPVDLVVGHDLHLEYIQRTPEGGYTVRLAEKFRVRIKQSDAIQSIRTT